MDQMTSEQASRSTPKAFVVLNPVAGRAAAARIKEMVCREFPTSRVYETTGDENVSQIVRAALEEGYERFIAAGGDGTVAAVASGLVHSDAPMGILPLGTGNGLARGMGIPQNLDEALSILTGKCTSVAIDVMQIGTEYYVWGVGVGLSALATLKTERQTKRRFGFAAYIWTAARQLMGFQPRRFSLLVDGKRSRHRAAEVFVANGDFLQPFNLSLNIDMRPDDGRLDVFVVRHRSLLDYVRLGWRLVVGWQGRDAMVHHLRSERSISIEADRPLPIQADGEIIGRTPVNIRLMPQAVRVIVPR